MIIPQIRGRALGSYWDFAVDAGKNLLKEEAKSIGRELLQTGVKALEHEIFQPGPPAQRPSEMVPSTPPSPPPMAYQPTPPTAPTGLPFPTGIPPELIDRARAAAGAVRACYFQVANQRHACTKDGWLGAVAHARALAAKGQIPQFILFVNGQQISMRRCVTPTGQVTTPEAITCPPGYVLVRDSAGRAVCMPPQQAVAQGALPAGQAPIAPAPQPAGGSRRGRRKRGMRGLGDWYGHQQEITQNAIARYGRGPMIPPYLQARMPPTNKRAVQRYQLVLAAGVPRAGYPYQPALPGGYHNRPGMIAAETAAYGRGPGMSQISIKRNPPIQNLHGLFT